MEGFALRLVLKQRDNRTRKWPKSGRLMLFLQGAVIVLTLSPLPLQSRRESLCLKVPMKWKFFPHSIKYNVWSTHFKIWVSYDENGWFYERTKLTCFTFKNDIRFAWSKRHVTSRRDVSLCVRDSSTSSSSSFIISSSEILENWRNYSIQNHLIFSYPLNFSSMATWKQTDIWRNNAINSVPVSWSFLKVK